MPTVLESRSHIPRPKPLRAFLQCCLLTAADDVVESLFVIDMYQIITIIAGGDGVCVVRV